jgi:low-density lipoprotein receptor-related protein 1 (alpha-2-macroglobulin receptor)
MDLDGGNPRRIRSLKNVQHVFSMAQFDDDIYWTDWNMKSIVAAHKFSGANERAVVKLIQLPNDLAVVHPLKQLQCK